MKICGKCKISKMFSDFNKNSKSKDGLQHRCRDCCKSHQKEYYLDYYELNKVKKIETVSSYYRENKETVLSKCKDRYVEKREDILAYKKKYGQRTEVRIRERIRRGKRRAREVNQLGYFPKDYWEILTGLFGERCGKCGSTKMLELDHVIPISKGGKHCISNAQILCRSCNTKKGNRSSADYRPFLYELEEVR